MADNHTLNYDVRELKLGASFTNNKASQYHTIKYDFKPASVDVNKMATVSVGTKNEVTVTVPHLAGAGVPQTVFKGNQKPYTKECVLIIDRVTGEITLEKLSSNIQVKKTRQESAQKARPLTPVTTDFTNTTQRSTSRTRVTTSKRTNNTNPVAQVAAGGAQAPPQSRFNGSAGGPKPPQNMVRSPPRVKTSPPQAAPWSGGGNSTLASLPMIGLEDALGPSPSLLPAPAPAPAALHAAPAPAPRHQFAHAPLPERTHHSPLVNQQQQQLQQQNDSSSSSSSDSNSDSESGSDSDEEPPPQRPITNGHAGNPTLPSDVLNDDLCLSESGSDSD